MDLIVQVRIFRKSKFQSAGSVCVERSLQRASSITDRRAETDSQPAAANTNREGADCAPVKSSFEKPGERFPSRACAALRPHGSSSGWEKVNKNVAPSWATKYVSVGIFGPAVYVPVVLLRAIPLKSALRLSLC